MNTNRALAIFCSPPQDHPSEELRYAEQGLLSMLQGVPLRYCALGGASIIDGARLIAREGNIPPDTVLIFFAHGAIRLGKNTLTALIDSVYQLGGLAYVPDRRVIGLSPPPDYLTLGGFERYTARLATSFYCPPPETGFVPLVFACLAATLQEEPSICPYFAHGTYCQDFGSYHQATREEMVPWIPVATRTLLDVGGGEGGFLHVAKMALGCETHLAEYAVHACSIAHDHVDHVWQGDFLDTVFDRRFDCISFLEVLEHTAWPVRWLEKARDLLTIDGRILISLPNVGHWSVIADLIDGRWDYAPAGIHCITHLRFFTRQGIESMLEEAGLAIERFESVLDAAPDWFQLGNFDGQISCNADSFNTAAFYILARRKS